MTRFAEPQLNIRTLPWLPVITPEGRRLMGLEEVLLHAHRIRRIDVPDPLAEHAVRQLLVSIVALLGRDLDLDSAAATGVAAGGFPAASVTRVLDGLDSRLWLIHPETPFLQEARFPDIVAASGRTLEAAAIHAAAIDSAVPGASSKAWWNVPGDAFLPVGLTPAEAVLALLKVWFHAPGGKAAIGPYGSRTALGSTLRVQTFLWWRGGDSLAHMLLANLAEDWLDGDDLPGWAQTLGSIVGPYSNFVQCTQSASAVLLLPNLDADEVYFERALYGGSPRAGLDSVARDELTAFKLIWKEQMDAAAMGNPRIATYTDAKTGEIRAGSGLSPEMAHQQNLLSWYRQDRRPQPTLGIYRRADDGLDALVLDVKLSGSYPEIKQAVWFSLGHEFGELTDEQYRRVTAYLQDVPNNAQMRLAFAVRGALPRAAKGVQEALSAAVIDRFYTDAEPVLDAAFRHVLAGGKYADGTESELRAIMVASFRHVLEPYVSVRTAEDIAHEAGKLNRVRFESAPTTTAKKGKK